MIAEKEIVVENGKVLEEITVESVFPNEDFAKERAEYLIKVKELQDKVYELESKISFDKSARLAGIDEKYLDVLWSYIKDTNQEMTLLKEQFPEFFKKSKLATGIGKGSITKNEKVVKGSKEYFNNIDNVISGEIEVDG